MLLLVTAIEFDVWFVAIVAYQTLPLPIPEYPVILYGKPGELNITINIK